MSRDARRRFHMAAAALAIASATATARPTEATSASALPRGMSTVTRTAGTTTTDAVVNATNGRYRRRRTSAVTLRAAASSVRPLHVGPRPALPRSTDGICNDEDMVRTKTHPGSGVANNSIDWDVLQGEATRNRHASARVGQMFDLESERVRLARASACAALGDARQQHARLKQQIQRHRLEQQRDRVAGQEGRDRAA